MNGLLRIDDDVDGVCPSLHEVLAALDPEARGLGWAILDLGEVVAEAGSDLNLELVGAQVANSPKGMRLSFGDLIAFAQRVDQVIDGVFVGCQWPERLPRRSDDDAIVMGKADMLVAAVDNAFWLVSASPAVLARVQQRFELVSEESLDAVQLSTGGRD